MSRRQETSKVTTKKKSLPLKNPKNKRQAIGMVRKHLMSKRLEQGMPKFLLVLVQEGSPHLKRSQSHKRLVALLISIFNHKFLKIIRLLPVVERGKAELRLHLFLRNNPNNRYNHLQSTRNSCLRVLIQESSEW
jgi:hypothetical protein